MPVVTRAQANQIQENEFAVLRKIETDFVYEDPFVITTRSATGVGFYKRWVYPESPLPQPPANVDVESPPIGQASRVPLQAEPLSEQSRAARSRELMHQVNAPESDGYHTPESTPPATPSPIKPVNRASSSNVKPVVADTDMKFLLHIKKDEDVREALVRHVDLYIRESEIRRRENQRRVYEFVKTQPHLLHEMKEDTEMIVREDSGWDNDPFL